MKPRVFVNMCELAVQNEPMFQFSVKLCAAVRKHECIFLAKSVIVKHSPHEWDAAWNEVAEESGESVEICKWRWQNIRKSFRRCLRRDTNKYYLHKYLEFLIPHLLPNEQYETKTDSKVSYVEGKNENEKPNVGDENSAESDSDTTSADETHVLKAVIKKKFHDKIKSSETDDNGKLATNQVGDFLIKEVDDGTANNDDDHDDDDMDSVENIRSRLRYRRACKRGLDAELHNELSAEQKQEEKRPRRSAERRKDLSDVASDEFSKERKSLPNTRKIEVKVSKIKFNKTLSTQHNYAEPQPVNENKPINTATGSTNSPGSSTYLQEHPNNNQNLNIITLTKQPLLVDSSTVTDFQTRDSSSQYDAPVQEPLDYDDTFINSLKPQLKLMNGRQKMNFKRKVFQSIMEVFDDATNFPNTNEYIVLPPTGAPRFDTTTTGELRLMRELVSLVQAAKTTPEIVNAAEKVTHVIENPSTPQISEASKPSSPVIMSPNLDDDDLSFTKEPLNGDEEPLPRTLEEIIDIRNQDDVLGLPRRVIHKVVKVAGTNGSTIVTGEGNRRRVYRIYPKAANLDANRGITTKKTGNIGTFYVTPSKITNCTTTSTDNHNYPNRPKYTTPNFTFRTVNKSPNNFSDTLVSTNAINRSSSTVSVIKTPNTPKGIVTPILNQSTGLFTMPYAVSKTPPSNNIHTKSAMLPPTSSAIYSNSNLNNSTMRIVNVKSSTNNSAEVKNQNTIMQRRYSICGPAPSVATPIPILPKSQPKPFIQKITKNVKGNPIKSAVSTIMISKPVSLKQTSTHPLTNVKTFLANTSTTTSKITPSTNDIDKTATNEEKSTSSINPATSETPLKAAQPTQNPPEIPVLGTAGTIAADTFADPLFVKTAIKLEPLD